MQRSFNLLFLFLFTCLGSLWAGPVTVDNARRTAEEFFRGLSPSNMRGAVSLKLVYQPTLTRSLGDDAGFYVFAPDTRQGFVIVSGDDTLTPVVGYSSTAPFNGQRIPDALEAWLDEYARYVADVQAGKALPYSRDVSRLRAGNTAIEPMLATQWDQGMPYNDLCPVIEGSRAPAGCVATAMAQIMKFHNWPDSGEGSVMYEDGKMTTVDFSKSVYDWGNMNNQYFYHWEDDQPVPEYTAKQGEAVAKLMYDCGRAVKMEYGQWASGTSSVIVSAALVDYFKYSPRLRFYYRDVMTTEDWIKLIRENLTLRQPLLYAGQGQGGHAFVCDGIGADDYVHINWGWSGYNDGYFDMAHLAPSGTGIGGGDGYFFQNQLAVAGIRPRTAGETAPESLNLVVQELRIVGETSVPVERVGDYKFETRLTKLLNGVGRSVKVDVGFCIKRDGVWQGTDSCLSLDLDWNKYFTNIPFFINVTSDPGSPEHMGPGTYEAVLCYTLSGAEEWYPVNSGSGPNGVIIEVSDSDIKIRLNEEVTPAQVSFVSIHPQPGVLYTNSDCEMTLLLKNAGASLFNSQMVVAFFPGEMELDGDTVNIDDLDYCEVLKPWVYGNSRMESYFQWIPGMAGRYRVRLFLPVDNKRVTLMPEEAPQYVTVVAEPKDPLPILEERFQVVDEIEQLTYAWVSYTGTMKCVQKLGQYTGKLALYATRKGDSSGKEFKLLEQEVSISGIADWVAGADYTEATINMEPGEYVAYLKYDAGGGEMVKVTPEEYNSAPFVLKASDIPMIYASAPIVVNGGKEIARGSRGVVEVTVTSNLDYTGDLKIKANANNATGEMTEVLIPSGEIETVILKAGLPQTLRFPYYCNKEAILGEHQVRIGYGVDEKYYLVSTGEYTSGTYFNVVAATEIEDASLDDYKLIASPDAFLLTGVIPGSYIQVCALDGKTLFEGTSADAVMRIPMSGASVGLYIVTMRTPAGDVRVLKGRRW